MPVLVAEEEPQQGLDRASSDAGFVLEIRFTDSQGAGNTLQADAKADSSSAFVTDSDSDTKMGGCMVFMLLLFILSASLCCCCCGRRHESEPEEVTVDVVDVEAFTPLMETYVETDSTEFISPLKPLEHEE